MDLVGLKVPSMFALSDRVHATDTLLAELLVHEDVERIEKLASMCLTICMEFRTSPWGGCMFVRRSIDSTCYTHTCCKFLFTPNPQLGKTFYMLSVMV